MTIKRRIKRRIEFSVETDEVVIIAHGAGRNQAFCDQCGAQVRVLTLGEAAVRARVPLLTVHKWLKVGKVHLLQADDSSTYICSSSLDGVVPDG